MDNLVRLLVLFVVLGIVWYFISPYVAEPFRKFVVIAAVIVFCLWLLSAFGIMSVPFRVR